MKNLFLSLTLLFVSLCMSAQSAKQLDSLSFILPEFQQGTVVYADKNFNRGLLNISPLDQMVYCITAQQDTLPVADTDNIINVSVAGRSFVKWRDTFVENIITVGDTGIGIARTTAKINNVKPGAYGMVDNSSSNESYTYDNKLGIFWQNIVDDPMNFSYKRTPYLYKDGKYYIATKKNFQRLFPDKKAYIDSVWDERKVNASEEGNVISFYKEVLSH